MASAEGAGGCGVGQQGGCQSAATALLTCNCTYPAFVAEAFRAEAPHASGPSPRVRSFLEGSLVPRGILASVQLASSNAIQYIRFANAPGDVKGLTRGAEAAASPCLDAASGGPTAPPGDEGFIAKQDPGKTCQAAPSKMTFSERKCTSYCLFLIQCKRASVSEDYGLPTGSRPMGRLYGGWPLASTSRIVSSHEVLAPVREPQVR